MTISNYGELKTNVADWLNRSDLTSVIPTFIQGAHSKLNQSLRVRQMVQRATASVDSEYSALPGDFLEIRDIRLNTDPVRSLEAISSEQQNQERERFGNTAGKPKYFTMIGEQLQVFPTPDTTYTMELAYYEKIPDFSGDSSTNWLLTKEPLIYVYGALVHATPYLKDDDRVVLWQTLYRDQFNSLTEENERARYGGTTPRMRHRSF